MTALGQKQTQRHRAALSALLPKSAHRATGLACPLCAKSGVMQCSKDAGVARFIRTAELRQRQSVIDTNCGRSAHVHTAVAEPSHATWHLLGFGCWRVCA